MESQNSYLVRIRPRDKPDAAPGYTVGFLVSSHWVITAGHCLSRLAEDEPVRMTLAGSETVDGRVVRIAERDDLGLICVTGTPPREVVRPVLARAADNDGWVAPARPEASPHRLTGSVLNADLRHRCAGGGEIAALELKVEQELGDYHGYSGGPVERVPRPSDEPGPPVVLGMLVEQAPKWNRSGDATNVLIAVQAEYALAELDVLADARRLAQENTRALQRAYDAEPVALTQELRELNVMGDQLDRMISRGLLGRRKARRFLHKVLDRTLRYWIARSNRDRIRT
ncbi:hypothetical protein ABGB07_44085 [Micromonosporaceae bacterium B7E4]